MPHCLYNQERSFYHISLPLAIVVYAILWVSYMGQLDLSTLTPQNKALGAFCVLPKTRYAHQEAGETILLTLRASPYTQINWVINALLASLLLIIIVVYVSSFANIASIELILLFGFVLIFSYAWYNFVIWYYNLGIVSTARIVDIDYYGVSKRVTTETRINKVADATAKISGFFGQIFNYGDVYVVTDGPEQNIEFINVPDPDMVVSIINSAMGASIGRKPHV